MDNSLNRLVLSFKIPPRLFDIPECFVVLLKMTPWKLWEHMMFFVVGQHLAIQSAVCGHQHGCEADPAACLIGCLSMIRYLQDLCEATTKTYA